MKKDIVVKGNDFGELIFSVFGWSLIRNHEDKIRVFHDKDIETIQDYYDRSEKEIGLFNGKYSPASRRMVELRIGIRKALNL